MAPTARILPYNTERGALVESPSNRYFPARIKATMRSQFSVTIPDVLATCMYLDHSLVVLKSRGKFQHPQVIEYGIKYDEQHELLRSPQQLCKLQKHPGASIAMVVVRTQDAITIVVCCTAGNVELIEFHPP
jgi:hypothetical protein